MKIWALDERQPCADEAWRERRVLFNPEGLHPERLYADLGLDAWVVKLRAPLSEIGADAASYASGKVRPECVAGLMRLLALRGAAWARNADALALWPTADQVDLLDKRFGGELTKGDVLGVEAEQPDSDDDGGDKGGGGGGGGGALGRGRLPADAGPPRGSGGGGARSERSGRSGSRRSRGTRGRRSRASSKSSKRRRRVRAPRMPPLDAQNDAFVRAKTEAARRRAARDVGAEARRALVERAASPEMRALRAAWAEWNPQRAAARELERRVAAGELTLEDTIKARFPPEPSGGGCGRGPVPGKVPPEEAAALGWCPHSQPFLWPAPRPPGEFARHELRPSEARALELREPWEEGTAQGQLPQGRACGSSGAGAGPSFQAVVRQEGAGVFTQDPAFWRSVHDAGDIHDAHLASLKSAERKAWEAALVSKDTTMHVLSAPCGAKAAAQADRLRGLLRDPPAKKGFAVARADPPPISMDLREPWLPPAKAAAGGAGAVAAAAGGGRVPEFDSLARGRPRSRVYKPGWSDAWGAGLHDGDGG